MFNLIRIVSQDRLCKRMVQTSEQFVPIITERLGSVEAQWLALLPHNLRVLCPIPCLDLVFLCSVGLCKIVLSAINHQKHCHGLIFGSLQLVPSDDDVVLCQACMCGEMVEVGAELTWL